MLEAQTTYICSPDYTLCLIWQLRISIYQYKKITNITLPLPCPGLSNIYTALDFQDLLFHHLIIAVGRKESWNIQRKVLTVLNLMFHALSLCCSAVSRWSLYTRDIFPWLLVERLTWDLYAGKTHRRSTQAATEAANERIAVPDYVHDSSCVMHRYVDSQKTPYYFGLHPLIALL